MKEQDLVMDNTSIHSLIDIGKCIHSRGYPYVYLPPYSTEMSPNEQFWVSCQEQSEVKEISRKRDANNYELFDEMFDNHPCDYCR